MATASTSVDSALRFLLVAAGGALAGITTSLATREPAARLDQFYARVRPPGFWGPVAIRAGDSPPRVRARLTRRLLAVAAAAVSLFCLLVGTGTWLTGAPAPSWFVSRPLWIATNLILGLATIPSWMSFGVNSRPDD